MSMSQNSILNDLKFRYQTGGILTRLIMINVAVFLVVNIVRVVLMLMTKNGDVVSADSTYQIIIQYFKLPSDPLLLVKHFWTIITHMFTHEGFFHMLFNMLWLYWFGIIFNQFVGESKLLPLYILGGLAGAFLYIFAYNVFPVFEGVPGQALGASAAVSAIIVATATMVPNHSMRFIFIGDVKLVWIAAFVVILDFVSIPNGNPGGKIAHLGGAAFGFLYIMQYKNGSDWSKPFYSVWDGFRNFFDFSSKPNVKRKSKVKMAYKNDEKIKQNQTTKRKEGGQFTSKAKQEKIDDILDKIGKSGYPSLTEEEKAFLFQYSRED